MPEFIVTALSLNLRSEPSVAGSIIDAVLPQGQKVQDLDRSHAPWWKVRTTLQGTVTDGFVHSAYLAAAPAAAPTSSTIAPVHLGENAGAKPSLASARAFAIGDAAAPRRRAASKTADLAAIINYLDVERGARYQPTSVATYCNIYAYDYCYLANVYLPRVWWTGAALTKLALGQSVEVRYAATVHELNANALFSWLVEFGTQFGWRRVLDLDKMQTHANAGGVGVICAQRRDLNRSGHIACVVPETPAQQAARTGASVVRPLQSQAGARNHRYTNGPRAWWQDPATYRDFGYFIID
jgi:hypothetical protein